MESQAVLGGATRRSIGDVSELISSDSESDLTPLTSERGTPQPAQPAQQPQQPQLKSQPPSRESNTSHDDRVPSALVMVPRSGSNGTRSDLFHTPVGSPMFSPLMQGPAPHHIAQRGLDQRSDAPPELVVQTMTRGGKGGVVPRMSRPQPRRAKLVLPSTVVPGLKQAAGDSALHGLVSYAYSDEETLQQAISTADVNCQNMAGHSPLHLAASAAYFPGMELLLAAGAHVNARDNGGRTALHYACCLDEYSSDVAGYLIDCGASVDAADTNGNTSLHLASVCGEEITATLLARGARVNVPNGQGATPLHFAATCGHAATVTRLLERGANAHLCAIDGGTPLDKAFATRSQACVSILQRHVRASPAPRRRVVVVAGSGSAAASPPVQHSPSYEKLQSELKTASALLASEREKHQEEVSSLHQQLEAMNTQLQSAKSAVQAEREAKLECKQEGEAAMQQRDSLAEEARTATARAQSLERDLRDRVAQLEAASASNAQLQQRLSGLQQELQSHAQQMNAHKAQAATVQAQLQALEHRRRTEHEHAVTRTRNAEAHAAQASTRLQRCEAELAAHSIRLASSQQLASRLAACQAMAQEELLVWRTQAAARRASEARAASAHHQALQAVRQELLQRVAAAERGHQEAGRRLQMAEAANTRLTQHLQTVQASHHEAGRRLASLTASHHTLGRQAEAANTAKHELERRLRVVTLALEEATQKQKQLQQQQQQQRQLQQLQQQSQSTRPMSDKGTNTPRAAGGGSECASTRPAEKPAPPPAVSLPEPSVGLPMNGGDGPNPASPNQATHDVAIPTAAPAGAVAPAAGADADAPAAAAGAAAGQSHHEDSEPSNKSDPNGSRESPRSASTNHSSPRPTVSVEEVAPAMKDSPPTHSPSSTGAGEPDLTLSLSLTGSTGGRDGAAAPGTHVEDDGVETVAPNASSTSHAGANVVGSGPNTTDRQGIVARDTAHEPLRTTADSGEPLASPPSSTSALGSHDRTALPVHTHAATSSASPTPPATQPLDVTVPPLPSRREETAASSPHPAPVMVGGATDSGDMGQNPTQASSEPQHEIQQPSVAPPPVLPVPAATGGKPEPEPEPEAVAVAGPAASAHVLTERDGHEAASADAETRTDAEGATGASEGVPAATTGADASEPAAAPDPALGFASDGAPEVERGVRHAVVTKDGRQEPVSVVDATVPAAAEPGPSPKPSPGVMPRRAPARTRVSEASPSVPPPPPPPPSPLPASPPSVVVQATTTHPGAATATSSATSQLASGASLSEDEPPPSAATQLPNSTGAAPPAEVATPPPGTATAPASEVLLLEPPRPTPRSWGDATPHADPPASDTQGAAVVDAAAGAPTSHYPAESVEATAADASVMAYPAEHAEPGASADAQLASAAPTSYLQEGEGEQSGGAYVDESYGTEWAGSSWVVGNDEDGNTYYYNYDTQESSWEPPAGWDDATGWQTETTESLSSPDSSYAVEAAEQAADQAAGAYASVDASYTYATEAGYAGGNDEAYMSARAGVGEEALVPSPDSAAYDASAAEEDKGEEVPTTADLALSKPPSARAQEIWNTFFQNALAQNGFPSAGTSVSASAGGLGDDDDAQQQQQRQQQQQQQAHNEAAERALFVAVMAESPDGVEEAVLAGAGVDCRDERDACGIHIAAARGALEVLYKLVELGADVDVGDRGGNTPLHLACAGGATTVVEYLLGCAADVGCVNAAGDTALHLAAANGNGACVRLLLEWGADRTAKGARNDTALERVRTICIMHDDPKFDDTVAALAPAEDDASGAAGAGSVTAATSWLARAVSFIGSSPAVDPPESPTGSSPPPPRSSAADVRPAARGHTRGRTHADAHVPVSAEAMMADLPKPMALGVGSESTTAGSGSDTTYSFDSERDGGPSPDSDVARRRPSAASSRGGDAGEDAGEAKSTSPASTPSRPRGLSGALQSLFAGWGGAHGTGGGAGAGAGSSKPLVANLGKPNGFRYDERLRVWVRKGSPASERSAKRKAKRRVPPPPPPPPSTTGPPRGSSGESGEGTHAGTPTKERGGAAGSVPAVNAAAAGAAGVGVGFISPPPSARKHRRRKKYVDTFAAASALRNSEASS